MSTDFQSCSIILNTVRDHLCSTLIFPTYHSLPIPVLHSARPSIGILIGRGEFTNPSDGYLIYSPKLLAVFNSVDGMFVELRGIENSSNEDRPLSNGFSPVQKLEIKFIERQIKYCQSVDVITKAVLSGSSYHSMLDKLEKAFADCSEPPLLTYFKQLLLREIG